MQQTSISLRRWKLPFFIIWTGEAVSLIGSNLAQFALVWWLTKTTGSATVLATATLFAMLPGIILGPLAGAFVDRADRRKVMIVSDAVSALAAACLAYLFMLGTIQIWHVYVIMFVRSIAGTFQWPAMQASTSLMVPNEHLGRIAGLNQTMQGSLNIISPPLGALLLSILPLQGIMAIDVVTAALAIAPLCFIMIPQPRRSMEGVEVAGQSSLWADMREGFQYVRRWPGLLGLLMMATLINFLVNPAFSLLPILVTRHFGGQALELGWMNSVNGAGILLGGVILGVWGGFGRRIITTLTGLIGMGAAIVLLGVIPSSGFWIALVAMGIVGLTQPITNGPIMALLQSIVVPEMQGRVFTLIGSLAGAMSPLGLVIAGPVSDWLGVRAWYLVGGIVCVLMGVIGLSIPAITHLEDGHLSNGSNAVEEPVALSTAASPIGK